MVIASDYESRSYKSLFGKFGWQFLMFVVGVLVASGVLYGIDKNSTFHTEDDLKFEKAEQERENDVERFLNSSGFLALNDFADKHNLDSKQVTEFIHELTRLAYFGSVNGSDTDKEKDSYFFDEDFRGMTFLEAFVLTISTVTTVGWGHVTPISTGAKALTAVIAIIGIPLTIMMIVSGSQIIIRLIKDLVRKIFGVSRVGILYKPVLGFIIILYILLTSAAIAKLEELDYHNALYYSIMSLTTVGFGDVVQDSVIQFGQEAKQAGLAAFQFFWLVFGYIFIGALILSFLYDNWDDGRNSNFHQIFKNKDEELVDDNEE